MRHLPQVPVRIGVVMAVVLALAPGARAQSLTAGEILAKVVAKNNERQAALDHYTGDRTYRIEYTGIGGYHMAELVVHADYRAPGRKHFTVLSERGSKPICEQVLKKILEGEEEASSQENQGQTVLSSENYDAVLAGQEKVDGIDAWMLDVTPKHATRFDYSGRIWVSMDDFGIMRVAGAPAKNPSWLVHGASFDYRYQRIGIFWLPEKNTSVTHVRVGGEAHLTIEYGPYTVEPAQPKIPATENLSASVKQPHK